MQLAKLRVYVANEREKAALVPVLVITDGAERIVLRCDGDPVWLKVGADRLVAGALDLLATLADSAAPESVPW